jgi:hypothetical protein
MDGKPVIAMVHLPALPGSPLSKTDIAAIAEYAVSDAKTLVEGGVHALMVENFGDVPFSAGKVAQHTVACMTRVIYEIRSKFPSVPLGVNVLRNDGMAALAVAVATGSQFIRVNVLSGARLTDQGIIEGCSYELLRARRELGADHIEILADVDVKHSYPLAPVAIEQEVSDMFDRALAQAVIVSGSGTGGAVDIGKLRNVKAKAGSRPVLLGSGLTEASMGQLLAIADGAIVGTALKFDGDVRKRVDPARVAGFMEEHARLRS